ncbi:MAG: hypothetical protein LHV68_11225 [Elusimicrobia bacterium]|nr:hypothetical protein [Candidatus Liberimonas magnetica]
MALNKMNKTRALIIFIVLSVMLLTASLLHSEASTDDERNTDKAASSELNRALTDKFFKVALDSFNEKDYTAAKKQFEAILSVYPGHAPSKRYLEKTYSYLNSIKTKQKSSKEIAKLLKKAITCNDKGDHENAKKLFNHVLVIDPNNETASSYLGKIDNSINTIAAAHVNELYTQALELYINGKYAEAIKYFEATTMAALKYFDAVILDNSQRLDTLDFINDSKQKIKEDAERVETLAKEKVRERVLSNYSRGEKFFTRGYYKAALAELEEGLKIASTYGFKDELSQIEKMASETKSILASDTFKAAEKHFEKGELEDAYESYAEALKYNPENSKAKSRYEKLKETLAQKYYEKGMELMMDDKTDNAKEYFKKALVYQTDKKEVIRALERIK